MQRERTPLCRPLVRIALLPLLLAPLACRPPAARPGLPRPDHIVVVLEENHGFDQGAADIAGIWQTPSGADARTKP